MYALIDACAQPEVLENIMSVYGDPAYRGFVITPYLKTPVIFLKSNNEDGSNVKTFSAQVRQYSLNPLYIISMYPIYTIWECKKIFQDGTENAEHMIDAVKFELPIKTEDDFEKWRCGYSDLLREIYRDASVYIKSFMYCDENRVLHVTLFNSESDLRLQENSGVPKWNELIEGIFETMKIHSIFKTVVRYDTF